MADLVDAGFDAAVAFFDCLKAGDILTRCCFEVVFRFAIKVRLVLFQR